MNALFGRSNNETTNQEQQAHANKDPELARRAPEEEDDINRRNTSGLSSSGVGSTTGTQQQGLTGHHGVAGHHVGHGTTQHNKERDVVVEQPAVVNEIVHDKNVHVVQPVVNRQVEVEHVKHHNVEKVEHEGKRVIDEGHVAGAPAGYQGGERGLGSRLHRKGSSSSSSSSDDENKRKLGTTHKKTGATTGTTGLASGVTGHQTGTTGTGLHSTGVTGHTTTGTTGSGLTGHSTTGTTAGTHGTTTGTHGATTTETAHHKTMGEKIKDVFKGHH